MKRLLAALLSITLALAAFSGCAEEVKELKFNADGEFNVVDLVLLQRWLTADSGAELANWKNADLCEDSVLDVFDIISMRRALLSKNN